MSAWMADADRDLIREFRERYASGVEADRANRRRDSEDRKFYTGGDNQWPDGVPAERRNEGRPCETFDRLSAIVRQVTGEIRQNKPAIRVLPVDGQTDPELAEVYSAIVRHIESSSDGHRVYAKETEKTVIGGQGWWRVLADYCDDYGFDQELKLKGVPNPNAVVCDPDAREPTRCDMSWCFVTELVSRKKFKAKYPGIPDHDWDDEDLGEWVEGDFVRIAEYWIKKEVGKQKLFALEREDTGQVEHVSEDDLKQMAADAGLEWPGSVEKMIEGLPVRVKGQREAPKYQVMSRMICGAGPLGEWQEWPGKYIPLVRVVGEEIEANDQVVRRGMIHTAKAAQIGYNFARNASMEHYASATKAPWLIALKAIPAAFKNMWETANRKNWPFLPWDPGQGNANPEPKRIAPPATDGAAIQESQLAAEDMRAATGIYESHLGAKSNETSGVAIDKRDAQGDTGTFVYVDNMEAAITVTGRILVDLIPHYYSDERIIRMLGEDGEVEKFVQINQILPDGRKWNDVTRGKYDVVVTTGPAFASKRQQASETTLKLMQVFPALQQAAPDIAMRSLDIPLAAKMADRLEATVPPGIDPDLDKKRQEAGQDLSPKPSPEEAKMMADVQLRQADQQARQHEAAMKLQLAEAEATAKMELAREEASARLQLEREKAQLQAANEAARAERENALAIEKMNREFLLAERKMQMEERLAQHSASMREKEVSLKANRPGGDLDK
jgi:hypothetical protein